MKILILNGSPRKGNSYAAIEALKSGIGNAADIEVIESYRVKIGPCMGCGICEGEKGCVAKDDSNAVTEKIVSADVVIFVSPVYWWGITAQLKLILDKCQCRSKLLTGKKVGVIIVGGSPVNEEQYKLIRGQFNCISDYLKWKMLFHLDYYAYEKDDLMSDKEALREIYEQGMTLTLK